MQSLGWGRKTLAKARRNGLPIHRTGNRCYALADEVAEWLKTQ
jgi:hypothetical protein